VTPALPFPTPIIHFFVIDVLIYFPLYRNSEIMRLLNSLTGEPTVFISDDAIPLYAILSHTWGGEEVSLQDLPYSKTKLKKGYKKIRYACDQALKDGIALGLGRHVRTHPLTPSTRRKIFCIINTIKDS
jgi:hypothetical protein